MPGAVSIDGGWSGLQSYTTGHHPEAMAYTLGRAVRLEARAITAHCGGRCGLLRVLGGYTYDVQKRLGRYRLLRMGIGTALYII